MRGKRRRTLFGTLVHPHFYIVLIHILGKNPILHTPHGLVVAPPLYGQVAPNATTLFPSAHSHPQPPPQGACLFVHMLPILH
jgi:hypothetical protein